MSGLLVCSCGHVALDHQHPDYLLPENEGRESLIDALYATDLDFLADCYCLECDCDGFNKRQTKETDPICDDH